MNSPLLWIGEQPNYLIENHKKVMDSIINYYTKALENEDSVKIPYKYEYLFLDNGAYTALYNGIELRKDRVMDLQEAINPDLAIPLDYPYRSGMTKIEMEKRWEKTRENIIYWEKSSSLEIVPPLHARGVKMLEDSIKWLQKNCDSDFLAIGSVITRYNHSVKIAEKLSGFFGDRQPSKQLIDTLLFVKQMIQKHSDFDIHIMGFGSSPLTYHLAVYCGIHSTDCSGHRRKAAYGKIILPGTGERYICERGTTFGDTKLNEGDMKKLTQCACPICKDMPLNSEIRKEKLANDWKLRAIHNKWVMEEEEKKAKELLKEGFDIYEMFLQEMFKFSGLRYMFKYARRMKKQSRVETWLEK